MQVGRMNNRLVLLRPETHEDKYGGRTTEYVEAGKAWAQLFQTNYREMEAQGTPMNQEQLRFKIRPRKDIRRGWHLMYQGREYVIDVVDTTYLDSTTLVVRRYEQGV